jgi:hypothetical protein
MSYVPHKYAGIFPMLSEAELNALAADIAATGLAPAHYALSGEDPRRASTDRGVRATGRRSCIGPDWTLLGRDIYISPDGRRRWLQARERSARPRDRNRRGAR